MAESRRGFAPVVLAGLATAVLTSVASSKSWFTAAVDYKLVPGVSDPDKSVDMPLAIALSLVVLAAWGALLVSRGRMRRLVAAIGLLAALGIVACVVAAPFTLPDELRDQLLPGSDDIAVSPTGWFVTAAVVSPVSLAVLGLAWRLAPSWPTMSSRYDAPAGTPSVPADAEPTDTDLWKALDAGHDPTAPEERPSP